MLLKLLSVILLGLSGNSSTQNKHKRNSGSKSSHAFVKMMTMMKKNTKKMMTMTLGMMIGGNLYW